MDDEMSHKQVFGKGLFQGYKFIFSTGKEQINLLTRDNE